MLEVRNLSVSLGERAVLDDVSFAAGPGRITAIIGPNGSGKTTLLKAISGELAYRGSVMLHGREIARMPVVEQAQARAVLPQATSLSFPFTVREVVDLGITGVMAAASRQERGRLIAEALATVDLAGFPGRFYQELSGGEQQRVQFARALCQVWAPVVQGRARFLLLDEPVSSLDIKHQLAVMQTAQAYAAAGGGVVAILHDLNLAAMFADAILVLSQGRALAFGPPAEVICDAVIEAAFDCPMRVGVLPAGTTPFVLPQSIFL